MEIPKLDELLDWRRYPPSALILIASNALALILALALGMDPAVVVWAYWAESVIIGFYTVLSFLTVALRSLFRLRPGSVFSPVFMAGFFTVHYGIFHAVYFVFLGAMPWFSIDATQYADVGLLAGIFLLSHGYSFVTNFLRELPQIENSEKDLGRLMSQPYSRIVPMHLAIILSGFVLMPLFPFITIAANLAEGSCVFGIFVYAAKLIAMLLFMALKTGADLFGHLFMHRKR